jgi:hypothetical protein
MTTTLQRTLLTASLFGLGAALMGCGGGIPVRLRVDEFTMEIALDDLVGQSFGELKAQGLFPAETQALPEFWPASLPAVRFSTIMASPPVPVDLTPDKDDPDFKKYEQINKAEQAVNRIELNRLVLRVDTSTLSIALPELRMQIADTADADPNDRLSWETIGTIPSAAPGFVGDLDFTFSPGGESYLNAQLADDAKEFAMRVLGKVVIDTDENPRLPAGAAQVRLIIVATFFVDPEGAANVAGDLANSGQ